ncbi:MAG TPA: chitobiase/beta-hexosaminidase C-terminal domain-containing protein [Candidatus Aquicultor sp.]|jgi:hypothetical protein
MKGSKRLLSALIVFILSIMLLGTLQTAYAAEQPVLSASGGGSWAHRGVIKLTEPIGFRRANEPVEVVFSSTEVKPQGEDIRITDSSSTETPCQVSVDSPGTYKVTFFAQAEPNAVSTYYLYYGNPNAQQPDYGIMKSIVDNQAKTWQTDGVFIQWGGLAGYCKTVSNVLTTLKFDTNGDGIPTNDYDCLTDEHCWDWFYGFIGSSSSQASPGSLGSSVARLVQSGPIFSEIAIGSARISSYKGQKWVLANSFAQNMVVYCRDYQYIKVGSRSEAFIPNNGSGDIDSYQLIYDSWTVNPQYLALRNPVNKQVIGGIGVDIDRWYAVTKTSAAWERIISFENSSNRPDAKIYWYADTSNNYDGISNLSKQVLNLLQVEMLIDNTPPVTSISTTPPTPSGQNGWYKTQPIAILSADETATIYFKLDSTETATYQSPITIPEGRHKLSYYSIDALGNTETQKTATFNVDITPPVTPSLLDPLNDSTLKTTSPILYWDSTDSVSGISHYEPYIDGTLAIPNLSSAATSIMMSDLAQGEHTWSIRAYDVAGNYSDSVTHAFTIDTAPPTTVLTASPDLPDGNSGWYKSLPIITLTSSEQSSTTYYKFDMGEHQSYQSPVTISEGIHTLSFYSTDAAGNKEPEQSRQFKVDSSGSQLEVNILPQRPNNYYIIGEPITFSCTATDSISALSTPIVTLDGALIAENETRIFNKPGTHTLAIAAQDNAGNITTQTQTFTVGYNFAWLRPVKRPGDPVDASYTACYSSTVPINFAVFDSAGLFITDKTVRVVVSDNQNTAVFGYGKTKQLIRINQCDEKYLLNITPKSYPWMKPGGTYSVSVYAGGRGDALIGRVALSLR